MSSWRANRWAAAADRGRNHARHIAFLLIVTATTLYGFALSRGATDAADSSYSARAGAPISRELELQSGVYGFSGAIKGGGSASGVVGECIWIYDAENRIQVAKGDCDEGNFRVPLPPGRYVVRGPGGKQKFDIKPHHWSK